MKLRHFGRIAAWVLLLVPPVDRIARISIEKRLRKSIPQSPEPVYRVDGLEVDLEHRRVFVLGNEVQLTATEYDLLRLLVTHAGKVLTHNQILRQMWGPAYTEQPHLLRVNISNLRRKIEPEPNRPRYILTELGVGYRLKMNP